MEKWKYERRHVLGEDRMVAGALNKVWKKRRVATKENMHVYNEIVVPNVLWYGRCEEIGDET